MKESAEVAVGRLFEQHGARLYRLGIRFCGSADEAHDLVQDVFLQAFRSWPKFDGRSSASTWLYTIAARRCQRRHRRRAGEPATIASLSSLGTSAQNHVADVGAGSDALNDVVRRQLQDRVAGAVAELPVRLRLPLILTEIAEVPLKDVALVLGLKLGTVKSRVHRARLALREHLEGVLPSRPALAGDHDHRFCQDLLQAKQEALDRGVPLVLGDGVLCERCASLFATLDLSQDLCRLMGQGEMPPEGAAALEAARALAERPPRRKLRPPPA